MTGDQNPGTLERLLHDLERTIVIEADTSLVCPSARDPFAVVRATEEVKSPAPTKTTKTAPAVHQTKMRLTGLVLDENPVAIVEVGEQSLEVKVGSLLEGHKVIGIDERGVHILKNGNTVTIK
jgi:hypothetical protein